MSRVLHGYLTAAIITCFLGSYPDMTWAHHELKWVEAPSVELLKHIAIDSDNDGIFDIRESLIGTNPDRTDSDKDGYGDLFEDHYRAFGFNPIERNEDGDNDGLTDRLERELGTDGDRIDSDGDGFTDFDEVMNARFGFDPRSPNRDSDFDGLTDEMERRLESNPESPDSNGDGVPDFQAWYEGIFPTENLRGGGGEITGPAFSSRMAEVIEAMRSGETFSSEVVAELPYPAVTSLLYGDERTRAPLSDLQRNPPPGGKLEAPPDYQPSAALLQSAIAGSAKIPYIGALYPSYYEIEQELRNIAMQFDGDPKPDIARLFYFRSPTAGHRWMYALKISDSPKMNHPTEPEMLFLGLHHGRELISASYTMELARRLTSGYASGDPDIMSRVNTAEIWIIPVVNPDGYSMAVSEFDQGPNVNWRKNIRKVVELNADGAQSEGNKGVDPNRNYDRTHIRTVPVATRLNWLSGGRSQDCYGNGLVGGGGIPTPLQLESCVDFLGGSSTYPGGHGFSDIEATAVRMLADDQFEGDDEIDGIRCSLSWHTGTEAILAPMNHDAPAGTVTPTDQYLLNQLGNAYAAATGFTYFFDSWWSFGLNYQAFGTSDDWLYTHNDTLPITVEAYVGKSGSPDFFPDTAAGKNDSVDLHLAGAWAFIDECNPGRIGTP